MNYTVKFWDNILSIEATHNEEYLVWSKIIEDCIEAQFESDSSQTLINMKLTAHAIFRMLSDYSDKCIDKTVSIKFPTNLKSPTASMSIEINIKLLPYGDYTDTKVIIMDPKEVGYESRWNKKLEFQKSYLEKQVSSFNKNLHSEIEGLQKTLGEKDEIISTLKSELTMKTVKIRTLQEDVKKNEESVKAAMNAISSLQTVVNKKADKTKVATLETALNKKADISSVNNDVAQIKEAVDKKQDKA